MKKGFEVFLSSILLLLPLRPSREANSPETGFSPSTRAAVRSLSAISFSSSRCISSNDTARRNRCGSPRVPATR